MKAGSSGFYFSLEVVDLIIVHVVLLLMSVLQIEKSSPVTNVKYPFIY